MRKEEFEGENLTTADLAQDKGPTASHDLLNDGTNDRPNAEAVADRAINDRTINDRAINDRPGPILAERPTGEVAPIANSEVRSASETRNASDTAPLFPTNELEELRNRWSGVQTAFVDEPRRAVEQADGLVASAMKRLAEVFAEERSKLEQPQRYRSVFHRLLSI
jgi:hypothetical protein